MALIEVFQRQLVHGFERLRSFQKKILTPWQIDVCLTVVRFQKIAIYIRLNLFWFFVFLFYRQKRDKWDNFRFFSSFSFIVAAFLFPPPKSQYKEKDEWNWREREMCSIFVRKIKMQSFFCCYTFILWNTIPRLKINRYADHTWQDPRSNPPNDLGEDSVDEAERVRAEPSLLPVRQVRDGQGRTKDTLGHLANQLNPAR